jgi:hypothetical protein
MKKIGAIIANSIAVAPDFARDRLRDRLRDLSHDLGDGALRRARRERILRTGPDGLVEVTVEFIWRLAQVQLNHRYKVPHAYPAPALTTDSLCI